MPCFSITRALRRTSRLSTTMACLLGMLLGILMVISNRPDKAVHGGLLWGVRSNRCGIWNSSFPPPNTILANPQHSASRLIDRIGPKRQFQVGATRTIVNFADGTDGLSGLNFPDLSLIKGCKAHVRSIVFVLEAPSELVCQAISQWYLSVYAPYHRPPPMGASLPPEVRTRILAALHGVQIQLKSWLEGAEQSPVRVLLVKHKALERNRASVASFARLPHIEEAHKSHAHRVISDSCSRLPAKVQSTVRAASEHTARLYYTFRPDIEIVGGKQHVRGDSALLLAKPPPPPTPPPRPKYLIWDLGPHLPWNEALLHCFRYEAGLVSRIPVAAGVDTDKVMHSSHHNVMVQQADLAPGLSSRVIDFRVSTEELRGMGTEVVRRKDSLWVDAQHLCASFAVVAEQARLERLQAAEAAHQSSGRQWSCATEGLISLDAWHASQLGVGWLQNLPMEWPVVRAYIARQRQRLCSPSQDRSAIRYLVYYCHIGCGGYGDRLRGISGAFMLAMLLDRVLIIDFEASQRGFDLTLYLEQNLLPWHPVDVLRPNELRDYTFNMSRVILKTHHEAPARDVFQDDLVQHEQFLKVVSNYPATHVLRGFDFPGVAWAAETAASKLPMLERIDTLLRLAYSVFFRPSPQLADSVEKIHHQLLGGNNRMIGVHMRLVSGVGGVKADFKDSPQSRASADQLSLYLDSAHRMCSEMGWPEETTTLFFCSDSTSMKELAMKRSPRVVVFNATIVHIDHIGEASTATPTPGLEPGFFSTLQEHQLLARCDGLVKSRSQFSATAYATGPTWHRPIISINDAGEIHTSWRQEKTPGARPVLGIRQKK